jgi:hypothetical protein
MIRIVLKRTIVDTTFEQYPDAQTFIETFDIVAPEVEAAMTRGGQGPRGYDCTQCVGIEVKP